MILWDKICTRKAEMYISNQVQQGHLRIKAILYQTMNEKMYSYYGNVTNSDAAHKPI